MLRSLLVVFFFSLTLIVFSQNTRSTESMRQSQPSYQNVKKEKKGVLGFLKKKNEPKTQAEEVADFRARMKKVYKQKAKEEKMAEKPQYSNPLYFGHKKPPKKRPIGKQKFCKICKIKH